MNLLFSTVTNFHEITADPASWTGKYDGRLHSLVAEIQEWKQKELDDDDLELVGRFV